MYIPEDIPAAHLHLVLTHTAPPHAHPVRHVWFPPEQRPIVLQLGGSDPVKLAAAMRKVLPYGYDEVRARRRAGAGHLMLPQNDCMLLCNNSQDGRIEALGHEFYCVG